MISIRSLEDRVKELSKSAEKLSSEVACASQDLSRIANQLADLTRGSRSGEEVTSEVKESVRALKNVASVISMVCRACDDYIMHVVS